VLRGARRGVKRIGRGGMSKIRSTGVAVVDGVKFRVCGFL
jgi:hypothetical protein